MVPQPIYPESFSSSASSNLNKLVKLKLREHSLILRKLVKTLASSYHMDRAFILKAARAKKEELMAEIWTIMTATLGVPPKPDERFTWDYYDKDGKPKSWSGTPVEFYKAFSSKQYPVRVPRVPFS